MDYHKCGEALQHWLESDSDQAVMLEIMLCDEKGQYVWGCSDRRMASIISLTSMQMAKRCLNKRRYSKDEDLEGAQGREIVKCCKRVLNVMFRPGCAGDIV